MTHLFSARRDGSLVRIVAYLPVGGVAAPRPPSKGHVSLSAGKRKIRCLTKRPSLRPSVRENPLHQVFSTEAAEEKRGYASPILVSIKWPFNIDNAANPIKNKQLALITELFCAYMEPLYRVSRGKTGEEDTGKRGYPLKAGQLGVGQVR
jgi:hypothetical protein